MSLKLFTRDKIGLYFNHSFFPDGSNYIRLEKESFGYIGRDEYINIQWIFSSDQEVIQLFLLVDAIRKINKKIKINLHVPYFPGARQDRVCEPGEAFNLKIYANLINSLNFEEVIVFDPHSDVTGALLNNIKIKNNYEFVGRVFYKEFQPTNQDKDLITIISPDAGANKKIFKLVQNVIAPASFHQRAEFEVIRADKQRNTKTHEIIGTVVYGDVENKVCFIIDDICSRGGTFMALAKRLKEMKASKVILIISHYEGTADERKLKESGIDKVYTYNHLGDYNPNGEKFVEVIN